MKILVIDDTQTHLDSAIQTLLDHDVTVCSSHDKAVKLLQPMRDEDLFKKLRDQYEKEGLDRSESYDRADKEAELPYWDAVLCDLLMPAGRNTLGLEYVHFAGQEMAVGWSLALMAVKNGAKYTAVITDMNHHCHPASAMLDSICDHVFTIDNAKMLMTNYSGYIEGEGIKGKNWGRVLKILTK